ncbi:hypothetical protein [Cronobacter sakazakii]|nr:hypothetical protein [Cronobacter sakazakii]EKY2102259.1 hypothetical protein [Cronobacter sakazakii]ELY2523495.1 hypothetical protein [Cronobacter sakazakii]ELY4756921.1 hypothetical protein [Cronobacter sakazakii]ELY4769343.1 hypothetical protein [Cronobacter sakazakii]
MMELFYWFGATLMFGGVLIAILAIAAMTKKKTGRLGRPFLLPEER